MGDAARTRNHLMVCSCGLRAEIDGYRVVFVAAAGLMVAAGILALWTLNVKELNSGVHVIVE